VTAPALTWRPIDPSPDEECAYPSCAGTPVLLRGPSRPGIDLATKLYCRSHAAMYGALVRRGRVVLRAGR
jgi:hypothetical protein